MLKRALAVVCIGLASFLGFAAGANALGVGLGVTTGPVATPLPVPPVVDAVVSGVGSAVAGTIPAPVASAVGTSVFEGTADKASDGVSTASYKTFENLVNDVETGGGSHGDVQSGDVFAASGVDGGVAGVPTFAPARLLK